VNSEDRTINWLVDEATVQRRRDTWKQRPLKANRGVLLRYARDVAVSQSLYAFNYSDTNKAFYAAC
jgi:hypothetical protein